PVSGVDRLGSRSQGRVDHGPGVQVGGRSWGLPDPLSGVGLTHVLGSSVGIRVRRHRPDPEAPERSEDPAGDLPPVRHEHRLEHPGEDTEKDEGTPPEGTRGPGFTPGPAPGAYPGSWGT